MTDSAGVTAYSPNSVITVNPTPTISIAPTTKTIDQGQSVAFTNTITGGTSPFSYAYTVNPNTGVTVSGNTITFANAGTFNVLESVTDSAGVTAYSPNSIILANPLPKVGIMPFSATINTGQSVIFSSNVSGGTRPYGNVIYSISQDGSATSNAVVSGSNILFESPGTYNVIESVTDTAGVTTYSPNSIVKAGTYGYINIVNTHMSANSVSEFHYAQSNATIYVASSNSITSNVLIRNVTATFTSSPNVAPKAGYALSKLVILNISVSPSTANSISSINVTIGYPSSYVSPAPYQLNGTSWTEITPFSVNSVSHTITFSISPDPVVGVFGFVQIQQQPQSTGTPIYGSGGTGVSSGSYNPNTPPPAIAKPAANTTSYTNSTTTTPSKTSNSTTHNSTSTVPNTTPVAQNSTANQTAPSFNGTASGQAPGSGSGNSTALAVGAAVVLIALAAAGYVYSSKVGKRINKNRKSSKND